MSGSRGVQIGVLGLAVAGWGACSGTPQLSDVATCSAAWQPITSPAEKGTYSPLVFAGGVLYYSTETDRDIRGLSLANGQESVIDPSNSAEGLWLEGDHLLFSEQSRFFSLPLAGGTAQLLFDGIGPNPAADRRCRLRRQSQRPIWSGSNRAGAAPS